jgi:hypothetical protein
MGDSGNSRRRIRSYQLLALWIIGLVLTLGAMAAMPPLAERYFWNWFGSQEHVIEVLREEGRWQDAAARAERMIESTPWDPRPLLWRAEVLRDQAVSQRRDPAADPAVHAAYEAAARGFLNTSGYPYALSPTWKRMMAETFRIWAATMARRGDWNGVAFALEYASDLDESAASGIIETLRAQTQRPQDVDPRMLETFVRLLLWHRTWQEADAALGRFEPALPPDRHAELVMRVLLEKVRSSPPGQRFNPLLPRRDDLPVRLLRMEWGVARQNRWHRHMRTGRVITLEEQWVESRGGWESVLGLLYHRLGQTEVEHLTASQGVSAPESVERNPLRGWPLWVEGELVFEWEEPIEVADHCWVMMSGEPTLGIWPVAEIQINGAPAELHYVRSESIRAHRVECPPEGVHRLIVRYLNDGGFPKLTLDDEGEAQVEYHIEDRNLHFNGLWWVNWEPAQTATARRSGS